ncbi:hypothetical protein C6A37_10135, partial [Desulfobacteraceae bacterium SEEP-SAG9]
NSFPLSTIKNQNKTDLNSAQTKNRSFFQVQGLHLGEGSLPPHLDPSGPKMRCLKTWIALGSEYFLAI